MYNSVIQRYIINIFQVHVTITFHWKEGLTSCNFKNIRKSHKIEIVFLCCVNQTFRQF